MARDDFSENTKLLLAKRVGFRCSNPNCRQPTSGPAEDPASSANIGVAAHITAAAKDGPRYDLRLRPEERRAPDNGIWLCQTHAKLIDSDLQRYTVDFIREWKKLAEAAARLDLEMGPAATGKPSKTADIKLLRFFSQCLDRPAFQDRFHNERSAEAFDKAIEDTITAFTTGCLRARDGKVLARSKGKSFLSNETWRSRMDTITDMLRAIRARYDFGRRMGEIDVSPQREGREWRFVRKPEIGEWIDRTRLSILSLFGEMCREASIPELHFAKDLR